MNIAWKECWLEQLLRKTNNLEDSKKIRVFFIESILTNETDSRLIEVFQLMKNDEWEESSRKSYMIWDVHYKFLKTNRKFNDPLELAETIYKASRLDAPLCLAIMVNDSNKKNQVEKNELYDKLIAFVAGLQNKNS
jgi:hypothetical protein